VSQQARLTKREYRLPRLIRWTGLDADDELLAASPRKLG
jgi:hypothetical protein